MFVGHRYRLFQTLNWTKYEAILPLLWAAMASAVYVLFDLSWLAVPALSMSLIGVAVAFYLGFKNNASYERTWEGRKIWGAIVNASRSRSLSEIRATSDPELHEVLDDATHQLGSPLADIIRVAGAVLDDYSYSVFTQEHVEMLLARPRL